MPVSGNADARPTPADTISGNYFSCSTYRSVFDLLNEYKVEILLFSSIVAPILNYLGLKDIANLLKDYTKFCKK